MFPDLAQVPGGYPELQIVPVVSQGGRETGRTLIPLWSQGRESEAPYLRCDLQDREVPEFHHLRSLRKSNKPDEHEPATSSQDPYDNLLPYSE